MSEVAAREDRHPRPPAPRRALSRRRAAAMAARSCRTSGTRRPTGADRGAGARARDLDANRRRLRRCVPRWRSAFVDCRLVVSHRRGAAQATTRRVDLRRLPAPRHLHAVAGARGARPPTTRVSPWYAAAAPHRWARRLGDGVSGSMSRRPDRDGQSSRLQADARPADRDRLRDGHPSRSAPTRDGSTRPRLRANKAKEESDQPFQTSSPRERAPPTPPLVAARRSRSTGRRGPAAAVVLFTSRRRRDGGAGRLGATRSRRHRQRAADDVCSGNGARTTSSSRWRARTAACSSAVCPTTATSRTRWRCAACWRARRRRRDGRFDVQARPRNRLEAQGARRRRAPSAAAQSTRLPERYAATRGFVVVVGAGSALPPAPPRPSRRWRACRTSDGVPGFSYDTAAGEDGCIPSAKGNGRRRSRAPHAAAPRVCARTCRRPMGTSALPTAAPPSQAGFVARAPTAAAAPPPRSGASAAALGRRVPTRTPRRRRRRGEIARRPSARRATSSPGSSSRRRPRSGIVARGPASRRRCRSCGVAATDRHVRERLAIATAREHAPQSVTPAAPAARGRSSMAMDGRRGGRALWRM